MDTQRINITELSSDPANARKHSQRNIEAIASSLRRFGQQKPIVVDKSNVVRAGNGTLEAARHLGWDQIDVVFTNLESSEATAFAIADNRTAELAEWNDDVLAASLQGLDEELQAAAGYEGKELEQILSTLDTADVVEDEVPEVPDDPTTQPGDLWLLGDHRLLCGDSTKQEDVDRLMDGVKADACFTSPPYALGKSAKLSGNKQVAKKGNAYDLHDDENEDWLKLMHAWFQSSKLAVSDCWCVNIQLLANNKRDLFNFVNDHLGQLVDVITWDKQHAAPQISQGVLTSQFEWMLVFSSKDNSSKRIPCSTWQGTLSNVLNSPGQRNNEYASIHGATMPIAIPAWVLGKLLDAAKSIYEPFCGSGTTLIAAEQLGRKCYGMELSPQYCDVIVERWQNLTGKEARRDGT